MGGSGSLRSAPPFLAPSPFPLGSLPNPLTLRVTSLGSGTRCFIFSLPPLPLGSSLKCSEGDPWAGGPFSAPLATPFSCSVPQLVPFRGVFVLPTHPPFSAPSASLPKSVLSELFSVSFYFSLKNLELSSPRILSSSFFPTFPLLSFLPLLLQRAGTFVRRQGGRSWLLSSHPGDYKSLLALSLGCYSPQACVGGQWESSWQHPAAGIWVWIRLDQKLFGSLSKHSFSWDWKIRTQSLGPILLPGPDVVTFPVSSPRGLVSLYVVDRTVIGASLNLFFFFLGSVRPRRSK